MCTCAAGGGGGGGGSLAFFSAATAAAAAAAAVAATAAVTADASGTRLLASQFQEGPMEEWTKIGVVPVALPNGINASPPEG